VKKYLTVTMKLIMINKDIGISSDDTESDNSHTQLSRKPSIPALLRLSEHDKHFEPNEQYCILKRTRVQQDFLWPANVTKYVISDVYFTGRIVICSHHDDLISPEGGGLSIRSRSPYARLYDQTCLNESTRFLRPCSCPP